LRGLAMHYPTYLCDDMHNRRAAHFMDAALMPSFVTSNGR